ncbi:MAG: stimulus-sensing domain-containing protein [Rhodospirillales bacterium]
MFRRTLNRIKKRKASPIRRRILAINLLALLILVAGLMYLGEYRQSLIATEIKALKAQAEMFAAALGEGAVSAENPADQKLVGDVVRHMVRRLVITTGTRARLFNEEGVMVADSRRLLGSGGLVQTEELPPPDSDGASEKSLSGVIGAILSAYDHLATWLLFQDELPIYHESADPRADHYPEVVKALSGEKKSEVRITSHSGLILSVAVPVQRYKQVLGALMLSKGSRQIDEAMLQVRMDILKVFAVALAVTVGLSLYLAGTIAQPIHRLAEAAERVRRGHHRQHRIPDFAGRNDEIGDLAKTIGDMTEALWQRMDAIESFAADVAHEIKNPLTSLNSAVETAIRLEDPKQQLKLMSIIQDDVKRLDRLISDISNASRLDAELSRDEPEQINVGKMLETMVDIHQAAIDDKGHTLILELEQGRDLTINAVEGRMGQVFSNLIDNAVSFSPPGEPIRIHAKRDGDWVEIAVLDEGPGIPDGKETAIFDRFYSERPESEKFGAHTGLGLSISKQIIEAHDGTIRAENRIDDKGEVMGARFVVRLAAEY